VTCHNILLVEDNLGDISLITMALSASAPESTVTSVRSHAGALAALAEGTFDCVLMDLGLPDADGLEGLCSLVAADAPPVVVLTGRDDSALALAAIANGAEDYLVKTGLGPDPLARAIRYAVERRSVADLLRKQTADYRRIVESLGEGVVLFGRHGAVISCNGAAERIVESAEYLSCLAGGEGGAELLLPDGTAVAASRTPVAMVLRTGQPIADVTVGISRPSGSVRWLSVNAVPVPHDEGADDTGVVVSFQDITTRRQAERRVQLGFEQAAMGLAVGDDEGRFTEVNPALCAILGRRNDELVGCALTAYVSGDPSSLHYASVLSSPSQDRHSAELEFLRPDGSPVWVSVTTTLVREVGGKSYWFEQFEDINDRVRSQAELERLAISDALTSLPNRSLLKDRIDRALGRSERQGSRVALCLVGIDRLKVINDSLGHSAGDALLVKLADSLRLVAPTSTVARLGGDVFAVVVEEMETVDEAVEWSRQHLLAASNGRFEVNGSELYMTSSTGIALARPGESAEDLIRNADLAMNRAKAAGGAHIVTFEEKDLDAVRERLELESDVRAAMAEHKITVTYQPVVRTSDHSVVGAEVLARWQHPTRGELMPEVFIPVIARLGLMGQLTMQVLRAASCQLVAWKRDGSVAADFRIGVNFSADDLADPALADKVSDALESSGLDARFLTVEVTETGLIRDTPTALATLRAIRRLGIRVALDDFGTGYSSLAYLKMFPVDVVKIDKSFVLGLGRDADATALVRGILTITRALGLVATAEGIENDVQLEALRHLGCQLAQGYFFSRPVPPEELPSAVRAIPPPDELALVAQAQVGPADTERSEQLGWAVMDALPTAVAVVATSGVILATNLAWKRFALESRGDASGSGVGTDYLAVCDSARGPGADDAALAARGLRAVLAGDREAFALEYDCDSPTERRRFLMMVSPVASGAGAALVVHMEITSRYLAELALAESEERFRSIFDQVQLGIFRLGTDGRIVDANRALCKIVGRPPDELEGSLRASLFDDSVGDVAKSGPEPGAKENNRVDGRRHSERRVRRPDGTVRVVRVNDVVVKNESGTSSAVVATVEDITDTLQLAEDLRRAQEMQALGRLAGGIAHEINTPSQFISDNLSFLANSWPSIAGVLGASQLAAGALRSGHDPAEVAALLEARLVEADLAFVESEVPIALSQSQDGVDRVATIVRAMKAFGHPDGDEPAPTDINNLISNTITVARNEFKYVADVASDFGPLPSVMCYRGAVSQVILNLIVNGAYAVAESGELNGRRGLITIKTWLDRDQACIAVSNTGRGIPPDVLPHIFEPFFTTKPPGLGTGQGLALAWATIVERHGGHIDVVTSGAGTTFTVRLPVNAAREEPKVLAGQAPGANEERSV